MTDRWTGRVIDGRYVVEAILGQGGMGVVLKARHKFTGAEVALKMLQPDLQMNKDAQERFAAEAQTPTSIGHPGIVQVLDAGLTPEGELYLAMELLTGRTLRQAMSPPMPPHIARRILLELLDALGAAHARGIVHRDMKPENVFLVGPQSTVKLLDFGIAKVVQAGRTAAGMMLGTLSYMAPEQLSDASSVDARADLWAVGVLVYEMLSGKLPFRGTHVTEIMTALATQDPDPIRVYLPNATPAMNAFFERALAKDRDQRFASAQDMAMGVAAMQLEGTAPGVIATLDGLGSPRSNVMTAADSGQALPGRQPFTAPQPAMSQPHAVATPVSASHAAQSSSPLFTPHVPPPGAPASEQLTPPPLPPSAQLTPPPMSPSTPMSAQLTPAPVGYGWQNAPSGYTVNTATPKKSSGMDKTSLFVIGGAVVAMVLVIVVFTVKSKAVEQGFEDCANTCETLAACNPQIDHSLCAIKCGIEPKTEKCVEQSNGSCAAFATCIEAAGGKMPTINSFDREDPSLEQQPTTE
ncbi:MAG: protein kinase [Deltaproteobacteria bacterium]|nr:protein kinase [Deltaproteobacteria bacterium]